MLKERVIAIFLLTGLFVLLFKATFRVNHFSDTRKQQFWIKKTFEEKTYNLVIMGDSRVYRGIDPMAFEKEIPGCRAVNFAYSSAGFSALLIEKALKKFKDGEKILVLGLTPFSLTKEAVKNEHIKSFLTSKREEKLEALYFKNILNYFEAINPQYILKKRYREELELQQDSNYYHESYHENGWIASWRKYSDLQTTLDAYQQSFSRTVFDSLEVHRSVNLLALLSKKGIKIFAFRPPVHEALYELEEKRFGVRFEQIKKQLIANGVGWIDLPPTSGGTYDGSHLHYKTAEKLSERLALSLKQRLNN